MSWILPAISVGMGLLGMNEQKKANSQAADQAAAANEKNNALSNQAMPYALQNLKTNQALMDFYQKNPFNDQQKAGYQNQNNLIDQFNGQVAPGLLGFANQMMGQQYSRQRGGAPGSAGYGAQTMQQPSQGLLAPFSAPKLESFGQIDWEGQNPFSKVNNIETEENFDPAAYLAQNPAVAGNEHWSKNPYEHYMTYGKSEGRKFTKKG